MERETKKRKTEYIEEEKKKEGDEEEKMEKFFALLRSTKEMHDHMRRNSNRIFKEKEEIKKVGEEKVSVAWNPSFLPEDFLEYIGKDSQAAAGPSKRKEDEKKDEGEEGTDLDLKLSL